MFGTQNRTPTPEKSSKSSTKFTWATNVFCRFWRAKHIEIVEIAGVDLICGFYVNCSGGYASIHLNYRFKLSLLSYERQIGWKLSIIMDKSDKKIIGNYL